MRILSKITLASGLLLFAAYASSAQLITDSTIAVKDNTIFSESQNSNGAGPGMFAGKSGLGNARRGLVKFSVLSMPADSVKSISIRLHVNQISSPGTRTFSLHKITSDWGEGTSVATGGAGAPPAANDATWTYRFYNTQSWATAGGDFSSDTSATFSISGIDYYTISNPKLLADYKSWMQNPSTNFGWILIGDETTSNSTVRIDSRESVSANAPKIFAGYNAAVLPLQLTSFKATDHGNLVQLSWQTSSEFNTDYFNIYGSEDGRTFTNIGKVMAAGTSSTIKNYSFTHYSSTASSYKLEIVGKDGKKEFSDIIFINRKKKNGFTIYPNPVVNEIQVKELMNSNSIPFSILNSEGKEIKKGLLMNGLINVSNLPAGKYVLQLLSGESFKSVNFIRK